MQYDPFEELLGKWIDVRDTADEWAERNLAQEVIDDLLELRRDLNA